MFLFKLEGSSVERHKRKWKVLTFDDDSVVSAKEERGDEYE